MEILATACIHVYLLACSNSLIWDSDGTAAERKSAKDFVTWSRKASEEGSLILSKSDFPVAPFLDAKSDGSENARGLAEFNAAA